MTLSAVKEKLHNYIDHADDKKVKAMFTLLENDIEATQEDDEIALKASIEKGLNDSKNGLVRPHDEVMADLKKRYNL
jgi:predicted transcriptional regulator